MALDPITLEILGTKFAAAAEEMSYFLKRTGRTLYVKEAADFATALVDLRGKFFAYPHNIGVSGFFDLDCSATIAAVGDLEPGDVIITNHPYLSQGLATHLPDLHIIRPYFHEGRIVCYGWAFVHSSDVGGRVASSISPSNNELFQEGLMIPPVKLVRKGVLNEDVVGFIRANCRTPDANIGDVRAMLAAMSLGARRVERIIAQHGVKTFEQGIKDVIAYSAARARTAFRSIPDGTYTFNDYLDDDLVSPIPLRVHVALTARDGTIHLDFSGSDPQVAAAYNLPTGGLRHSQLTLWLTSYLFTRDPTLPLNSGLLDPVTIVTQKGSFLNPVFPAAVGVRHATVGRVIDALNGALAQALPDYMPAAGNGVIIPTVLAEPEDGQGNRNVIVVQPMVGGSGARHGDDGVDGRHSGPVNIANNPLETVEAGAGVVIHCYALRPDSGGPGRWRGGTGVELTFSPLQEGSQVLGRGMDRFRFQPWGLAGGQAGRRARTVLNYGRPDERELGKIDVVELGPSDTVTVLTPGGGGYGDPLERPIEEVLRDTQRGVVSVDGAFQDYGVVIRGETVDEVATERRRQTLRRERNVKPALFDFGSERTAWEGVFHDDLMARIVNFVLSLPQGARRTGRQRLLQPLLRRIERGKPFERGALEEAAREIEAALDAWDLEAGREPVPGNSPSVALA